jgi:Myb/SANT-like DNA-binding domain
MATAEKEKKLNDSEKDLIVELVANHIQVLECKVTNKTTTNQKTEEWKKVEEEWKQRAMSPSNVGKSDPKAKVLVRSGWKLKKAWENLKHRAKTEVHFKNKNGHFWTTERKLE